jgi:hypothetical protein
MVFKSLVFGLYLNLLGICDLGFGVSIPLLSFLPCFIGRKSNQMPTRDKILVVSPLMMRTTSFYFFNIFNNLMTFLM